MLSENHMERIEQALDRNTAALLTLAMVTATVSGRAQLNIPVKIKSGVEEMWDDLVKNLEFEVSPLK